MLKSSQIWNHLSDIFILEGFHIENLIKKNTNDSYSIGQITENVTFLLEWSIWYMIKESCVL